MNSPGFNFQALRQLIWSFCQAKGLPESHYVIYGQPDFIESSRTIREDFRQVAILLDPIGECPGQMAEGPVSFNSFLSSDLIMVQHEEVLQLAEAAFNFPAKSIQIKDLLHGKPRVVCDQNMYFLWIFAAVRSEEDHDFQRYVTILELAFEVIGHNGFDFLIRSFDSYRLYFVPVVFFDEGDELVLLHEAAGLLDRMIESDVPVGLDLPDDGEILGVQRLNQLRRMGIPGIKNDSGKPDIPGYGVLDEILGQLNLASESMQVLFIEFLLLLVEFEMDGEVFGLRGKSRGDEDVADRLFPKDAAVLIACAFGLLRVDLGTGGIIDNQNTVRGRSGGGLFLDQGDSFVVEPVVIPFGIRKEILQVLVGTGGGLGHDFHIGSLHVLEKQADVQAEIEELSLREKVREPAKKLVDERTVCVEDMHDLCSSSGSVCLLQLPTVQGAKAFFYGNCFCKASNECKSGFSQLTLIDFFEMLVF